MDERTARLIWERMTPEQREAFVVWVRKACKTFDAIMVRLGEDVAEKAEHYANWGPRA